MGNIHDYDPYALMALLRRRREQLGITQEEAAYYAGTYKSVISRLENMQTDDVKFGIVAQLAYLYGLDLNQLATAAGLPVRGQVPQNGTSDDPQLKLLMKQLSETDPEYRNQIITMVSNLLLHHKPNNPTA